MTKGNKKNHVIYDDAEPNGLGEGKYLGPVFVTVMMRLSSALALTVALNCRHWKTDKQILQNV